MCYSVLINRAVTFYKAMLIKLEEGSSSLSFGAILALKINNYINISSISRDN